MPLLASSVFFDMASLNDSERIDRQINLLLMTFGHTSMHKKGKEKTTSKIIFDMITMYFKELFLTKRFV